ncbi:MAG: DUF488 domain-containing protein [Bryobacterales bacterium]|nr:DUF488 domain-containing protein [Bryobacterales bacterium]
MTARQNTIIRILDRLNGATSKLHLVKLEFLLSQESSDPPRTAIYEFVPYKRGPYSFTLYYDLAHLDQEGVVQTTERDVRLVGPRNGQPRDLAFGFSAEIDRVLDKYASVPVSNLIADVYRRYPWYTAKSDDLSKRAVKLPQAPVAVYKVGYEDLMVDGLMNRLLRAGIGRLIDVRCNPVARRFGFHKSTLQRVCTALGIEYVHIPNLGVPSDRRQDLGDEGSYSKLFDWYESELNKSKKAAVVHAVALMKSKPSALMCREADPACCHRTRLAKHVAALTGLPVVELDSDEAHVLSTN